MTNNNKQPPPVDRGHAVALILFILGVGTLLPWNFFITATQYFNNRLNAPNVTFNSSSGHAPSNSSSGHAPTDYNYDSWMSVLSQLPLLCFTLLNSFFYHRVKVGVRVVLSLVFIFLLFCLTAVLVSVPLEPQSFFSITMATVWFISTCSAVLQGSLFGVVSVFPHRYSVTFMSGQALSGIFAAAAMLCSILGNSDQSSAALSYFITPSVFTLLTLMCYLLLPHLEFARFHLNPSEIRSTEEELLNRSESNVARGEEAEPHRKRRCASERSGARSSLLHIFKKIWTMALCITCVFSVTLAVFPVVTVRVQTVYKDNATWDQIFTCVCCFIVFNSMDFVGRGVAALVQWPSKESFLFPVCVAARLVFVPLLLMCNLQSSSLPGLLRHDAAFVSIMAVFSFTNGYQASLCMAYAPKLVDSVDSASAGALMTFFLVVGLTLGAWLSFLLVKLI